MILEAPSTMAAVWEVARGVSGRSHVLDVYV